MVFVHICANVQNWKDAGQLCPVTLHLIPLKQIPHWIWSYAGSQQTLVVLLYRGYRHNCHAPLGPVLNSGLHVCTANRLMLWAPPRSFLESVLKSRTHSCLVCISSLWSFLPGKWSKAGGRVCWVRSTQTTCTSAAGAGPVVTSPEHLPMDSDTADSSDSEVKLILPYCSAIWDWLTL